MVRIGDTHVGRGVGGNIGDHIIVDLAVIGVEPDVHMDVGVQLLEGGNAVFIHLCLVFVGVIFRPEGDLILF